MLNVAGSSVVAPSRVKFGAVLRATAGNFLEMFDFFLFGIYARQIAHTFFPNDDPYASLMLTFLSFAAGFAMRPIGALVLGPYVDRMGRRKGLIVTLSIMATGTIIIAFTPGYAAIGLAAPIIVVIGRLLQGFSAGVELGGVSVYLAEISTPGRKGFTTSFQSASQQVAVLVAALIGYTLNRSLSADQLLAWGWRIPFLVGCLIVPVIFVLRRSLEETPEFLAKKHHPTPAEIYRSVAANWAVVAEGMMLVVLTTVSFYFITVYTPDFGKTLDLSASDSLLVTLLVAATNFFWLPVGGALSDRVGRQPVLLAMSALILFASYPALAWLATGPSFGKLIGVEMLLSCAYGVYNGAMVAALTEVVPAHVRASCFALAYSLATALFGTSTPIVSKLLIRHFGDSAPALWLCAAALCSIAGVALLYRRGAAARLATA